MKHVPIYSSLFTFIIFLIFACSASNQPSQAIIMQAKYRVTAIMDSVTESRTLLAGNADFIREYYDPTMQNYVLEYEVPILDVDSTVTKQTISVFIKEKDDHWIYDFILEKPHSGKLGKK